MQLKDFIPIVISIIGVAIATTTLYIANFRPAKLVIVLGPRTKLNHTHWAGFTLTIPITIANESTQPGIVHKVSIVLRMEQRERGYRYLDWDAFVVYKSETRSWDTEELAHPLIIPGKSSTSKLVRYVWADPQQRFMIEAGLYRLRVLCWTSLQGKASIVLDHFLEITPQLAKHIVDRVDGATPPELIGLDLPPLSPGSSYNTDLTLDQQLPVNTFLTETQVEGFTITVSGKRS